MKPIRTIIVILLMLLTYGIVEYSAHSGVIKPLQPLSTFPQKIGPWVGAEGKFDKEIYDILGVDDSFYANYRNNGGNYINLYIGYYASQKEGDLIHSPKNCMPGAGWNITNTSLEEINLSDQDRFKVIKLTLQKDAEKQLVLYWFQSRGRIIASEYRQKIYLVIDSITRHRTDGSFVRLIAPVNGSEQQALNSLKDFAVKITPLLRNYIPS